MDVVQDILQEQKRQVVLLVPQIKGKMVEVRKPVLRERIHQHVVEQIDNFIVLEVAS